MSVEPRPASHKERCLEDLQNRILTLDIQPGADLDEAGLCQRYELSRTPLREILQRLAGEGYVTLANHRGARVASMDFAAMRAFFQTAPLIYCSVARLAAEHRTPRQIDALRAAQAQFRDALDNGNSGAMALLNHRVHRLIGAVAANDYLMPSLERLLIDHTRLGQTFYRPASPAEVETVRQACDQHDAMIEAIEARDRERAVALTLQHWDLSRHRMDRFVRPDPLPMDVTEQQGGGA